MFMGMSLRSKAHVLFIDVLTQAAEILITEENKAQQIRPIFNPIRDISTKCYSFWFIAMSLPLQDLNFLSKELKIMKDPQIDDLKMLIFFK